MANQCPEVEFIPNTPSRNAEMETGERPLISEARRGETQADGTNAPASEASSVTGALDRQARGDASADATPNIIDQVMDLPLGKARQKVVEEFERRYVDRLLARHRGNVTRAAESAGVARRYFQIIKARSRRSSD